MLNYSQDDSKVGKARLVQGKVRQILAEIMSYRGLRRHSGSNMGSHLGNNERHGLKNWHHQNGMREESENHCTRTRHRHRHRRWYHRHMPV